MLMSVIRFVLLPGLPKIDCTLDISTGIIVNINWVTRKM